MPNFNETCPPVSNVQPSLLYPCTPKGILYKIEIMNRVPAFQNYLDVFPIFLTSLSKERTKQVKIASQQQVEIELSDGFDYGLMMIMPNKESE